MTDALTKFKDAMRDAGCAPDPSVQIEADEKMHYYRLEGDKPKVEKGSYIFRIDPDGFAAGGFMSHRDGHWHGWHSKSSRKASAEEKQAWQDKQTHAKAARDEAERVLRDKAAAQSLAMWNDASAAGVGAHPYIQRKGMTGDGMRVWTDLDLFEDILVVPVTKGGQIVGLQKIAANGEKLFVYGSDMRGGHYWLGSPDGADVVAIGEGVATCDTVRQATGWPTCVAFNAGNLKAVCEAVARDHPRARIVVVADNDKWTWANKHRTKKPSEMPALDAPEWAEWRANGWLHNTGLEAAKQAVAAIGGAQVLFPECGGDWNDYAAANGLDATRDALMGPVAVTVVEEWVPDYDIDEVGPSYEEAAHPMDQVKLEVRPQGYIGKKYYFFPRSTGDIEEMSTSDLRSEFNLYHLARESFWHRFFDDPSAANGKEVVRMFTPRLMEMCKDKGKFDPDRVMSTGVWPDGKLGVVANMGDRLYIPGAGFMDHADYESDKVYISAPKSVSIDVKPMTNASAVKLRTICESLNWKNKISGSLLAGWIYASILSGVMRWRPHIYITGQKGSGKTTVMKDIIKQVLRGWSTNSDGGTTEAGFRRKLGNQARPVVSDEMETETEKQRKNADDVLFLARQSSSGAEYSNAYVDITVHSCFCFGGISPNIKNGADKDRITVMELVPDKTPGFRSRWKEKEKFIKETLAGDYGRQLIRRAIDNAESFLYNVEVFEDALSEMLGSSRSAEQFAPMIAGLYALHGTGRISPDRALEWVKDQDWEFFRDEEEGSDAEKMVSHLLTAMAEYTVGDRTNKVSVADLISLVIDGGIQSASAAASLGRYGLRIESGWLMVANSKSRIGELMRDTPWAVPKNTLGRYPGAEKVGVIRYAPGVSSRGIRIPLGGLIDGIAVEEELPFNEDLEDFE